MYRAITALVLLVLASGALPASAQTRSGPQVGFGEQSSTGDAYQPGIAPSGAGFVAADRGHAYFFTSSDVMVGSGISAPAGGFFPASLAELRSGNFVIASQNGSDIFIQRYNKTGQTIGSAVKVNPNLSEPNTTITHDLPVVSGLSNGGFVVAWMIKKIIAGSPNTYEHSYVARLFDKNAAPVGGMLQVSNPSLPDYTGTPPAVTALGSGGFVICWALSGTITRGQRYSASGGATGPKFVLGDASHAVVASQPGGGFVVVWQSAQKKLFGLRYNMATSVGAKFPVNPPAGQTQQDPAIARLANGGFVVAWAQGGTKGSIYAATYSAAAHALHEPVRVNQNIINDMDFPSVAALTNGGFAVAWSGYWQMFPNGLAQAFKP